MEGRAEEAEDCVVLEDWPISCCLEAYGLGECRRSRSKGEK